jgi:hypothetical protein
MHIQWEKILSVIYAKKMGTLFVRLDNNDEASGLEGGDEGFQFRLNQLIWLLEEYYAGRIPLTNSQMAIYWLDGYKSKRLYNGNLHLIVIDISKDSHANILKLASIDSNAFDLNSPAIVGYSTESPFPSPLPNYRQFTLPSSATEYFLFDLSFQRLNSFLSMSGHAILAEENGKTFRQLIDLGRQFIDLGRQFKSVKGDAFYYAWFKYLLDSALSLLANHPDQGLVEALRVSIEDDRLDKYIKEKVSH